MWFHSLEKGKKLIQFIGDTCELVNNKYNKQAKTFLSCCFVLLFLIIKKRQLKIFINE